MGIDSKRFISQPVNGDFICSICEDVFEDPVERRSCEHIFCRECITRWLLYNPICPIDRERLSQNELQEAPRVFKSLLGSLQIGCTYINDGCTQAIKLESLSTHEKECSFGPGPSTSCVNNCGFKGSVKSCHSCLDVLKKRVQDQDATISLQRKQIESLKREIEMVSRNSGRSFPVMPPRPLAQSASTSRGIQSSGPVSNTSHREGIEKLWKKGVIKSRVVLDAMMTFNLTTFYGGNAFKDGWAFGHAKNLEAVVPHLTPTFNKVLVNNNFSGYFQACLSNILGPNCKVFTIIDGSTNGIQILRTHYPQVFTSDRVVPINTADASNDSPYSMIIDFSKEKVTNGRFDRLAAEGSFIVNPWTPSKLRQRVNNEIRHVMFFSIFGDKKYRYSNHGSTRPL